MRNRNHFTLTTLHFLRNLFNLKVEVNKIPYIDGKYIHTYAVYNKNGTNLGVYSADLMLMACHGVLGKGRTYSAVEWVKGCVEQGLLEL